MAPARAGRKCHWELDTIKQLSIFVKLLFRRHESNSVGATACSQCETQCPSSHPFHVMATIDGRASGNGVSGFPCLRDLIRSNLLASRGLKKVTQKRSRHVEVCGCWLAITLGKDSRAKWAPRLLRHFYEQHSLLGDPTQLEAPWLIMYS